MDIKDINKLKEQLEEKTTKGFGYFMKNIGMVILMFISIFILTNPSCITDPDIFFASFNIKSLWVVFALFMTFAGFYQLARNISAIDRNSKKEERITEYEEAITRNAEEVQRKHSELAARRIEIGPKIDSELKSLLINLDADRAAILEMHNGTNNASGLPFIYADMAYEQISPKVGYAQDEFKNFNLAKLPFVSLHYKEKIWIGTTDEIEHDDAYFAAKLRVVSAEFGVFVTIEGINGPIGFLTLHYNSATNHPSKSKIIAEVNHSSQIISNYLSGITD